MKQVGIFTATRWEFKAVRRVLHGEAVWTPGGHRCFLGRRARCHVILVRTGFGPERAAAACREVLHEGPLDLAVSSGLACALGPARIGDILVGTDVVMQGACSPAQGREDRLQCDGEATQRALRAAERSGAVARSGSFVTVPRMLWRAAEKREVAERTGAIGLDMESAAIGAAAAERKVPFVIVRATSDLVDEDLPLDFNLFLQPAGWPQGIAACLAKPASLGGLLRLRSQMRTASDRISAFFARFLDDLP